MSLTSQTGHQLNLGSDLSLCISPGMHNLSTDGGIFFQEDSNVDMIEKLTSLISQTLAVESHRYLSGNDVTLPQLPPRLPQTHCKKTN